MTSRLDVFDYIFVPRIKMMNKEAQWYLHTLYSSVCLFILIYYLFVCYLPGENCG